MTWEEFKVKFSRTHVPPGLIKRMRDEFRELKQGRMTVVEYRDKFLSLARYAPDEIDTEAKKKERKLDYVKVRPFLITEVRGPVNYKLQLPNDAKIHPVFHISLLEPADPETPLQTTFHFQTEEEDEFEVEKILEQRGQRYLVKWKGYPHSENTWEPRQNLRNC